MKNRLDIPNSTEALFEGDIVRLGRFSNEDWLVRFGWYSFGGNRPVCGWFLESIKGHEVKPVQLPDLDDIYVITR